ncbi:SMP-30/gluconolactonase/LRE family protein [Rhizorhabdus sp. FW153]|uniref:SMP-30/gluconolactonase/LRE family protein n=1 Tax=Rhizorhabdus sp. FW153 TaxID=3400216 RepID=UPI003CF9D9C6
MADIAFLGEHRCKLGESPLWDARNQCLWWVDARAMAIFAAKPDGTLLSRRDYAELPGSIALAEDGLLVAFADRFCLVDAADGSVRELAALARPSGSTRLNDGKLDRQGRFFFCGETQLDDVSTGRFWRLGCDALPVALADGIRIGNAICFSPDGREIFFADSLDGFIRRHRYDAATGVVGETVGRIMLDGIGKAPDGATIDADGNLWIALVLDQAIACVSPNGALLRRIEVPMPFPSCPAFGGPDLDILFVTSIGDSGRHLVTDHADGGRILAIRDCGARGIAEARFATPDHIRD